MDTMATLCSALDTTAGEVACDCTLNPEWTVSICPQCPPVTPQVSRSGAQHRPEPESGQEFSRRTLGEQGQQRTGRGSLQGGRGCVSVCRARPSRGDPGPGSGAGGPATIAWRSAEP
jgi:hypothetical protein